MRGEILFYFPQSLSEYEIEKTDFKKYFKALFLIGPSDSMNILFSTLTHFCNLEWRGSIKEIYSDDYPFFKSKIPFNVLDLKSINPRVKYTQIILHSQGTIIKMGSNKAKGGRYFN